MKDTKKSARSTAAKDQKFEGFTAEERAAMKEHAQELKTAARRGRARRRERGKRRASEDQPRWQETDRVMAERIHAIVKASAPTLLPKLWYGMPAYAEDGKVVCFFQPAEKFKSRYSTLASTTPKPISTKAPCGRPPSR